MNQHRERERRETGAIIIITGVGKKGWQTKGSNGFPACLTFKGDHKWLSPKWDRYELRSAEKVTIKQNFWDVTFSFVWKTSFSISSPDLKVNECTFLSVLRSDEMQSGKMVASFLILNLLDGSSYHAQCELSVF